MKLALISIGSFLGIGMLALIIAVVWGISTYNQAASIKNTYEAKIKANQASFDSMKAQIREVAEVSDMQLNKLQEIFNTYAEARTPAQTDAAIVRWVQESVPNVDTSTLENVQNTIRATRTQWESRQTEAVEISRAFNEMLVNFPSNFFLKSFGFTTIVPTVITSSATQRAFETGIDEPSPVFNR